MNKKQNLFIYALLVVFTLSTIVASPAGLLGVDVAFAATSSNLPTSFSRVLVKGAIGNDVKLLQTLLNNEGFSLEVDGSFGPLTLKAVKDYQSKNGLKVDGFVGPQTSASLMNQATQKPVDPTKPVASGKTVLKVGRADYAAHGTKAFANAAVVLAGDKIVAASIDEYQFMAKASNVGVPNSDQAFGENYADQETVLASKLANAATYSANMATKAGSTVSLDNNFKAIENFVKGKTVAELEDILAKNTKEQMVDVVSTATLVDTDGYVKSIVAAAKLAKANDAFVVNTSALDNLTISRADYAAHGTKAFASVVTLLDGDKIIAASIDEYQFMAKASNIGVPNSDQAFGENYADRETVLASKLANAATYSANMAKKAGSTVSLDKNFNAIEAYAAGKTVAELEDILAKNTKEQMVDAVSTATLVDTDGYLKAIVVAAKNAPVTEKVTLKVGRADYAAHGTKAFANAAVVLAGDKIVAASIDEYQFMAKASNVGVPNSDQAFGENYADKETVLASKLANAATYSANMATKAGSTVSLDNNFKAIESFVKGKTVAELEDILAKNTKEQMVDVVSTATLVDTDGYVKSIVAAAKLAKANDAFVVNTSALDNLTISRADYAAHGTKAFASVVTLLDGDKIVAASIDEYQFMAKASNIGVPNSDQAFGENYADQETVLASKLANATTYSANMATKAGSTVSLDKNFNAIEAYASGKTVAELENILAKNTKEQMVDAVSTATLVDTDGYLKAIVAAAKLAK